MTTRRNFQRNRRHLRCRCCLTKRAAHSHHVVYKGELENRGLPLYDMRNAMELCLDCHFAHHGRSRVIPLLLLTDVHLDYAFEALGAYAFDYLGRLYAGEDPRLHLRLQELA